MEIRVYCESIEQGQEFFLPIFETAFQNVDVKLVRIPRVNKVKNNRGLKGVFDLANPDGLATIVEGGKEFPFATFEISDAVKTEDHEFQRFPQVCSAMSYDLIYIKISPHNKETRAEFGGNIDFDPLAIPRILRDNFNFRGAYMLNWPNGDDDFVCKRNPDHPSCPADGCIELLQTILSTISKTLEIGKRPTEGTYDFSNSVWASLDEQTKSAYDSVLDSAPTQSDLFDEWASKKIPEAKGYLRKRMTQGNKIRITIPRFEKDSPGPGEVMGYAMISRAKTVEIAYCGRDRGMRIDSHADNRRLNHPCNSTQDVAKRFFDIFAKTKDKMPKELLQLLEESWNANRTRRIEITAGLAKLANSGKMKKWVLTMVFFADFLVIHDRPQMNHPVTFHWDRSEIIGHSVYSNENPMDNLRRFNDVTKFPPLSLKGPMESPVRLGGEDYVTWAATHILKEKLGCSFVALSYPGSQGDGAILPSGSSGLKRQRTYCDGLGILGSHGLLLEAKHKEGQIGPDVRKLRNLKSGETAALSTAYSRLGVSVDQWKTCLAFSVSDGNMASSYERRHSLAGIDLAFTVSDATNQYQILRIADGTILFQGDLPKHRMHSIA